ncbi:hypothetical protein JB92DRAFT_3126093 [Gautieria morchelliformis]|nr:hypothetical protein JB92DRAFT_3126093 [Gautieria morchelliformis]
MPSDSMVEGTTDNDPIHPPAPVTVRKLDNLMSWFYAQYSQIPTSDLMTEALEDILELSSYLMIESGRSFAIAELEHHYLMPTVKLLMAQRHQISNWVPGVVQALVMRPPSFFTLAEYEALGTQNIYTLEKV